jgi:hypothetical protein
MEFVGQLWLPIILSGVIVFIASALAWTVLPHHKKEWTGLKDEAGVLDALRKSGAAPGLYMFPWTDDPKERRSEAMKKRWVEGPAGMLTIVNGASMLNMGPMMMKSLVFNIVVAFFAAYVAHHALASGAEYLKVFRIVGTVGFMAYGFGTVPDSIWFGKPWKSWFLHAADSLVYGLLMAGTFGWLWPR